MTELDTTEFREFIEKGVTVVDFWAEWCMPCKIFAPVLEELSDEIDEASFGKVNIDNNTSLAQEFSIQSIPTVIVFKDGEPVERMVGVLPKDQVLTTVQNHL